jgi:hypothetical protein
MSSEPSREYAGGCMCGAVRYRISAEPIMTRACWCRDCQYFGAGSGTVNVVFPRAAVIVSGELSDFRSIADSGNVMHRRSNRPRRFGPPRHPLGHVSTPPCPELRRNRRPLHETVNLSHPQPLQLATCKQK